MCPCPVYFLLKYCVCFFTSLTIFTTLQELCILLIEHNLHLLHNRIARVSEEYIHAVVEWWAPLLRIWGVAASNIRPETGYQDRKIWYFSQSLLTNARTVA